MALLDLSLSEDLKTGFKIHDFANRDQDALATMLKHPNAVIGLSDGGVITSYSIHYTKLYESSRHRLE